MLFVALFGVDEAHEFCPADIAIIIIIKAIIAAFVTRVATDRNRLALSRLDPLPTLFVILGMIRVKTVTIFTTEERGWGALSFFGNQHGNMHATAGTEPFQLNMSRNDHLWKGSLKNRHRRFDAHTQPP